MTGAVGVRYRSWRRAGSLLEVGRAPRPMTCPDCGRTALSSAGFVYRKGDPFAIYYAVVSAEGHERSTEIAIGVGEWQDEGAAPGVSAFLRAWSADNQIRFGFVDPTFSPWVDVALLQGRLHADQARTHARRDELLEVAECIARDDPAVARHLGS